MAIKKYSSVVSILTAAIPLIEKGWIKGMDKSTDVDGNVSYCAIGAIRQVSRGGTRARAARLAIENALHLEYPLYDWNDRKERRKRDVISAFKRTVKIFSK